MGKISGLNFVVIFEVFQRQHRISPPFFLRYSNKFQLGVAQELTEESKFTKDKRFAKGGFPLSDIFREKRIRGEIFRANFNFRLFKSFGAF